ncbi:hypothetical protein [Thioclava atlantica]|uniref:Uncharacterized protein n=1 Tax=Thioclava atlantica TaxID=1317124 RepID=A0A085U0P3_9RHOB|nr:hypothetical protein [Thioclava atlantica]KFE36540.1 hypothetical protein DW2_00240 [Thioclava atlantica]
MPFPVASVTLNALASNSERRQIHLDLRPCLAMRVRELAVQVLNSIGHDLQTVMGIGASILERRIAKGAVIQKLQDAPTVSSETSIVRAPP